MQQFQASSRAHYTHDIRQSNVATIVVDWHRHQAVEHLLCWRSHCEPAYLHVLTDYVGRHSRPKLEDRQDFPEYKKRAAISRPKA